MMRPASTSAKAASGIRNLLAARGPGFQPLSDIRRCVPDELADLAVARATADCAPESQRSDRYAQQARKLLFIEKCFEQLVAHFACPWRIQRAWYKLMMRLPQVGDTR